MGFFSGVKNLISGSLSLSDELMVQAGMGVKVGRFHLSVPKMLGALEEASIPGRRHRGVAFRVRFLAPPESVLLDS